eukprot:scaffold37703_cov61-Phaeocystis_antarctica.AAC.1
MAYCAELTSAFNLCVITFLGELQIRGEVGSGASQIELLERRQRAAVERSGEGGAASVGDLGLVEVERLEHPAAPRGRQCPHRRAGCHRARGVSARAAAARPAPGPPAPRRRWRRCPVRGCRAAAGRLGPGRRRAPRHPRRPHAFGGPALSGPAARPLPAPPPAPARAGRGRVLASGAPAAPSPACPAS